MSLVAHKLLLDALLAGMVAGCVLACVQHLLVWVEAKKQLESGTAHSQPSSENTLASSDDGWLCACAMLFFMQQICSSNIYHVHVHLGRGKPRSALTQLDDRHCGRTRVERGVDSGPQSTGLTGRQRLTVDSKSTVDSGRQRSTGHTRVYAVDRVDRVDSRSTARVDSKGRQRVDRG